MPEKKRAIYMDEITNDPGGRDRRRKEGGIEKERETGVRDKVRGRETDYVYKLSIFGLWSG